MTPRRLSRWLAPLALLAALLAVVVVVSGSTQDGGGDNGSTTSREERSEARRDARSSSTGERTETGARTSTTPERRTYTVRPGDTLALISERTGVPVEELQELNPDVDPNSLTVGQKIKLRE